MTPRWYRTRWFWAGLLGLILWIGAWAATYSGTDGHLWSWTGSQRSYYLSCGTGWIGTGVGDNGVRATFRKPAGFKQSTWDHDYKNKDPWFPPVQFQIEHGQARLWSHCSVWISIWVIAWLAPLICWHRPRRTRPPHLPGTPRRWFSSPFLWPGLPVFITLIFLWIDSFTHRNFVSWKWTREHYIRPRYLGFGLESNCGRVVIWAGVPSKGLFFNDQKSGLLGDRIKSSGDFLLPDARSRKGARTFQTTYLALTSIYLLLWASMAATWQYRQSRLSRLQIPPA